MSRLPLDINFNAAGDDLAPNFDIKISGKDTNKASQLFDYARNLIAGVEFEDDEELSSLFKLDVINQPQTLYGQPANWRAVIDSKLFAEGNFIDLYMGYGNLQFFMERVEIVKWLPDFPDDGPSSLVIKGFDGRHRMSKSNKPKGSKKKTFYRNLPDEMIVQKVAKKHGFLAETDATEAKKKAVIGAGGAVQHVFKTRVQAPDKSDWEFLQKLADINRFDLWCSYDNKKSNYVINFKKREDAGSALFTFTYNGDNGSLISATPDFSIQDQVTDVEVLFYDRKRRSIERTIIQESTKSESVIFGGGRIGPGLLEAKKTLSVGARVRFTAFGQTIDAFSDRPFKSKKEASNFVQNWLREREREFLIMQGRIVGYPLIRSRQIHELVGLGSRLDGFYRFTNVKHRMKPDSGIYHIDFTAHKILSEDITRRPRQTKVS